MAFAIHPNSLYFKQLVIIAFDIQCSCKYVNRHGDSVVLLEVIDIMRPF
jgi:hypothetical protein